MRSRGKDQSCFSSKQSILKQSDKQQERRETRRICLQKTMPMIRKTGKRKGSLKIRNVYSSNLKKSKTGMYTKSMVVNNGKVIVCARNR
ncbi:hypothetical protein CRE_21944 [Caenorhabditis remanei]|uniref:Uncharacterized protein n=1 Tax=Caenorhabditis remanei TaxID=31234 RepID=E3MUH5_CAERE|nr:hypothetical protein CRE_21944 [Caenorhabditis remanei]